MPVEFLTDDEVAAYGRFAGAPSRADLERVFFLDDEDRALVGVRRGEYSQLGFALQLVTVRWLGTFLEDPVDVPVAVVDFIAEQLGVDDSSHVREYTSRRTTSFEHQMLIRRVYGWVDFTVVEADFVRWVSARAWTSGDGPKAIFADALGWLRRRKVLLPGVTTLARLIARLRQEASERLWDELEALVTSSQRHVLEQLLEIPRGLRVSDLERWRKGVTPRASGPSIIKALDQVAEVTSLGLARVGVEDLVPQQRLDELAKYGMRADASTLRRHLPGRRVATLLATVRHLEGKSVDDALELLDLLMVTELLNKARSASDKDKVRTHPRLATASARLAAAVEVLFAAEGWGEQVRIGQVWEAIEEVVSREQVRAALMVVSETAPPVDTDEGDDWRTELVKRFPTVSGFLKVLTQVITFGANAEGAPVLAAMTGVADVLAHRSRLAAPLIGGHLIDVPVVSGPWKRLVFGHPAYEGGAVNRHAYALCVLERFWRCLKRREIFAETSTKWRNPQAALLDGERWQAIRTDTLTALGLPESPDALLAEHARALDDTLREVGGRLTANTDARVDEDGRIHLTGLKAVEEPPFLVDLRSRTTAMLPRVELPEVILEVMGWVPELPAAFTAASGGQARMGDLPLSIAACLTAHSLNVGYRPIAKKGVPALERSRLSHVYQNYFRPETLSAANVPLVDAQATLRLAQAWGGGLVAAVDGMRFVVPVPAAFARPNRKYFGSKRGMTWLNAINDRGMGRGAKVVSGTIRDSLHMVDVIFGFDGGALPEIVVTDTGSYSDLVFGLLELLGISYRPALADLPDQKGWRINTGADYGPLDTFARGKVDLGKIRRNWDDIVRVVSSFYTGSVRAYDVVTMLQRDGHPTALGEAIAAYGRIFKTLHILTYIDVDESYRRDIKDIRNLQENRHSLARKICHGKRGELYHHYERGLENQLGALGLVLNCATLWTTRYLDAAVTQLRDQDYPIREDDLARLSPFVHSHLGVLGTYTFATPNLAPGTIRDLRDPDAPEEDDA